MADLRPEGRGEVRHFRIDEVEHPVEYASIERIFETVLSAYDAGIYRFADDGYLDVDAEQYAVIAAPINPDIPWWTDPV